MFFVRHNILLLFLLACLALFVTATPVKEDKKVKSPPRSLRTIKTQRSVSERDVWSPRKSAAQSTSPSSAGSPDFEAGSPTMFSPKSPPGKNQFGKSVTSIGVDTSDISPEKQFSQGPRSYGVIIRSASAEQVGKQGVSERFSSLGRSSLHTVPSPNRSGPSSPNPSGLSSPNRSGPSSPNRSGPSSPNRSGPSSPNRSGPSSPNRSGPSSPNRSESPSPSLHVVRKKLIRSLAFRKSDDTIIKALVAKHSESQGLPNGTLSRIKTKLLRKQSSFSSNEGSSHGSSSGRSNRSRGSSGSGGSTNGKKKERRIYLKRPFDNLGDQTPSPKSSICRKPGCNHKSAKTCNRKAGRRF
ncbi:uncharacterized protein FA14DRAFT_157657 [Meira miltonrushii]|uniref:Uncharacterized protein n=1 Tax=Meira miltonrushii TaxID=1280837 RepID=A0A316V5Y1_9BASI|nr:uncharacterized protein FA14DRAFT_157657 [Meira miltonrushii]PWN32970.1 hypothetical protein FA14DRAFT_157657 [Meira miltonrushii]